MDMKSTILLYLVNKCDDAENRFNYLREFYRFHDIDEVDMIEHLIAKVRRDTIREILTDITNILKIRIK